MARIGSREDIREERAKARRLERTLERTERSLETLRAFLAQLGLACGDGEVLAPLAEALSQRLGIRRLALYRRGEGRGGFDLVYALGVPREHVAPRFEPDCDFARWLRRGAVPAAIGDFPRADAGGKSGAVGEKLEKSGFRYACAACDPTGMPGLILFGPKIDGDGFTIGDAELLQAVMPVIASVLGRAAARQPEVRSGGECGSAAAIERDFFGRALRELQTALGILKSSLWSLETAGVGDAVLVEMAKDAVLRMQDRCEQVLALNEMNALDRTPCNSRWMDASQIVEDVCRGMIPEFEEREITVKIDDRSAGRVAPLDQALMRIVLGEVLDVALESAGRGGRIEIGLGVEDEDDNSGAGAAAGPVAPRGETDPTGGETWRSRKREAASGHCAPRPGPWLAVVVGCRGGHPQRPENGLPAATTGSAPRPASTALRPGQPVSRLIVDGHGGKFHSHVMQDGAARFTILLPL